MKNLVLTAFAFLAAAACQSPQQEPPRAIKTAKQTPIADCRQYEHALDCLMQLPEVKKQDRFVDSLTKHQHGITFIDYDQGKTTGLPYYEIHVGYSSEIRFENYFTFRVNKKSCRIEVDDPITGLLPLAQWRKQHKYQ